MKVGEPPADTIGKRALVHWNLHKRIYSVKVSGQPVFYAREVWLSDCVFRIDQRLRAKFEARPSRRTVHAHVHGTIRGYVAHDIGGEDISCNPFRWCTFVRKSDAVKVTAAAAVMLHADRRIEATGIKSNPTAYTRADIAQ